MLISIIGTNGMISSYLATFFAQNNNTVNVYGIERPQGYLFSNYIYNDLLKGKLDYEDLIKSDLIIYAAGAGVQAGIKTDAELMYQLNVFIPIKICVQLRDKNYEGAYISFGSYMEIGVNDDEAVFFNEKQIELSTLPVTNDYAMSKRLLTRFMGSFKSPYKFWHFILPNVFMVNEKGTRLIPYVINYLVRTSEGELCEFPKFSSGNQVRQYINFEDVCIVITKCLDKMIESGVYNIGGGEVLSIRNLIERMFSYYKLSVSDEMFGIDIRRDSDIKILKISGEKLLNEIDYLPVQKIESIFDNETKR